MTAAAVAVGPPVAASLEGSGPNVTSLLTDLLEKAVEEPTDGARRGALGMAYEVNGYLDAAFRSYRQAEALDAEEPRWPYFKALILARWGDHEGALVALDRVLDADPSAPAAWMWRGIWSLGVGALDEAEEGFAKAIELGVGLPARLGQARVLLNRRKAREAVAVLSPIAASTQHPNVFRLLGRAYREAGRTDDARLALARGRQTGELRFDDRWQDEKQKYAIDFNARAEYAERLAMRGRANEAIEVFESLLAEEPDNEAIINHLSLVYGQVGEAERAFWTLRRAIEKYPEYYPFHINIADIYQRRGDRESALSHLNRAIGLHPTLAVPHTRRGKLLLELGEYEAAIAAFEASMRSEAGNPEVHYYAGHAEAMLKRWPAAIARFEEAVRLDPTFAAAHVRLVDTLGRDGQWARAKAALKQAAAYGVAGSELDQVSRRMEQLGGEAW